MLINTVYHTTCAMELTVNVWRNGKTGPPASRVSKWLHHITVTSISRYLKVKSQKKIAVKMGGTIPKMTCIPSWFRFIYSRYVLQFFASNKKVSKRFHKYHLAVFVSSLFVRTHIVLAFTPFWILPTRVTRCGVWPFMNHSCRIQAWCPLQASEHLKHLFGTKSNWSILIY